MILICKFDEINVCVLQVVEFLRKENANQERKKQKELELKRAKKEALKRELERLEKWEMEEKKRAKQVTYHVWRRFVVEIQSTDVEYYRKPQW